MQQIGYADGEEVDDIVRALTAEDVKKGAALAGLDPLLTIRERLALLAKTQSTGALVLNVGPGLWVSLSRRLAKAPPVANVLSCTAVLASTRLVLHGLDRALLGLSRSAVTSLGAVTATNCRRVHICLVPLGSFQCERAAPHCLLTETGYMSICRSTHSLLLCWSTQPMLGSPLAGCIWLPEECPVLAGLEHCYGQQCGDDAGIWNCCLQSQAALQR